MRSTARRVQALQAETEELENGILALVRQQPSAFLDLLEVGTITAASDLGQLVSTGMIRPEAAFASFVIVSPIPPSAGPATRHRLNRSSDRQPNRAIHTITLIRMRLGPLTKTYVACKIAERHDIAASGEALAPSGHIP